MPLEEKRSHSRAGCDCQLSVRKISRKIAWILDEILRQTLQNRWFFVPFQTELIDLGPASFPRHIRNVTCDEHKRCFHSRAKGLHCLPIHYQVTRNVTFSPNYLSINYNWILGECDKDARISNATKWSERSEPFTTEKSSMLLESDDHTNCCWMCLWAALLNYQN